MSALRPELVGLVEELLVKTPAGGEVTLDALGDAIGARAISQDEIDLMLTAIEEQGRTIATPSGGQGEAILKTVLAAARSLRSELGRAPTPDEVASRAGLSLAEVQHALSLARIMQR